MKLVELLKPTDAQKSVRNEVDSAESKRSQRSKFPDHFEKMPQPNSMEIKFLSREIMSEEKEMEGE